LFDLHQLTVNSVGRIEVWPKLSNTYYAALAGAPLAVPRDPRAKPDPSRLAEHRRSSAFGSSGT
jgi:hypothetical protein